ncbi:CocE/NonD family hydrolase [Rhodoplanes azumiensis]|uniref:CocE/NonD family hydrolase n=1 Tax=Rhodoplanes azumiensis TaxID=1897628 RepID=A0ABW5AEK0_9BRAD
MTASNRPAGLPHSADRPPVAYDRAPTHSGLIAERDVAVPMRDGVALSVDVYRPDTDEKLPVLLAFSIYNKDLQGPDVAATLPPQPAWSSLWAGLLEAGDTKYFVSRGYVHVIGSPRNVGKSDSGGSRLFDSYDLIEWIAQQPWCDGNVGMVGISGFGAEQLHVARQKPPHLKAIFPLDPRGAYGVLGSFREEYPGGVLHLFRYLIMHFAAIHGSRGKPGALPPEREALWQEAMRNPDYRMYPHILNVLTQKGQHMPPYFDLLIDPYDREEAVREAEAKLADITVPTYTGSGWYAYTYKTHLQGAHSYYEKISAPKKLMFAGPAHLERPFHTLHGEILRWHDHWLKGLDTGIMDEPPVRYWVMGAEEWREGADWPLPETQWTKLYLDSWERLRPDPFVPSSVDDERPPDAFVQMPPTQTNKVASLRYLTDPLPADLLVAGPMVLNLFAAIDQDDTNWFVTVKDVGPDVSVRSVREGEREIPADLPEREVTRGWLKASHRAVDPERSTPWRPWHPLTRAAQQKVVPGEVTEYAIEILATANLFRRGHRICVEIASADMPTGVGGATNAEYVPNHIVSSRTTLHRIYHDAARPSHLLLPVIPQA